MRYIPVLVFWIALALPPQGQAQVAGKTGATDAEQVIDLTDQWAEAQRTHNTDFLRLLIADDFEAATAQGDLVNKAQLLERVGSPNRRVDQFHADDRKVRVYGNVAILVEHTKIGVADKSTSIGGEFRIVRIYLKRNDKWQCEMVQVGPPVKAYTESK
jgi:ketosteroid isomerase-like protein